MHDNTFTTRWLPRVLPHIALVQYLVLAMLLLVSLVLASGVRYLHYMLLFLASLGIAYAASWRFVGWLLARMPAAAGGLKSAWRDHVASALLAGAMTFVVLHLVRLGGVPVIHGMLETDYHAVMLIRQSIFDPDMPALWRYGPNILVKSILPFIVFYYISRSRLGLFLAIAIGAFYAVSLMNKLFILLLVIPGIVYAVISRRWLIAALLGIVPAFGLAFLVQVQNPHLQSRSFVATVKDLREHTNLGLSSEQRAALVKYEKNEVEETRSTDHSTGAFSMASNTLFLRVLIVPGEVITSWFTHIPDELPYGKGCGYRWMAPLLGCQYVSYAVKINEIEHPELTAKGVKGSMTAASFVEDYANFGAFGLVWAGVLLALILSGIGRLFGSDWKANVALNAVPFILLLETPVSTAILTGGWIFTLLLYWLLGRPERQPEGLA